MLLFRRSGQRGRGAGAAADTGAQLRAPCVPPRWRTRQLGWEVARHPFSLTPHGKPSSEQGPALLDSQSPELQQRLPQCPEVRALHVSAQLGAPTSWQSTDLAKHKTLLRRQESRARREGRAQPGHSPAWGRGPKALGAPRTGRKMGWQCRENSGWCLVLSGA